MEPLAFRCKRCQQTFTAEAPPTSRTLHLWLGVLTLGAWLVLIAYHRLFQFYRLSQCPACQRRSRTLLWLFLSMAIGSAEVLWSLYYFIEIAPARLVREVSLATLPDDMDLTSDITSENFWKVITFVTLVGLVPYLGAYISSHWPYLLLAWFSLVVFTGLGVSSFYKGKT